MTNKPSKPINLFDCATSQKVIGQENFLNAFKTILNHGGYARGRKPANWIRNWLIIPEQNSVRPAVRAPMR